MFEDVFNFTNVRRALVLNFGWLIHVSPDLHLGSIRAKGLIANRDAGIPDELEGLVPSRHILCLHPLGAKVCPPAVCNTIEHSSDIEMVTYAIKSDDFPQRLHIDWSNAWNFQSSRIAMRQEMGGEALAKY